MYESAVKLLRAVSEVVGGEKALAERLGVPEALLSKLMSGKYVLPDPVLLRAVDVILEDRESRPPLPSQSAVPPARDSKPDA